MSLLELEDVHAYYGNIHALMGISLKVEQGEIVALIGANGAGKTTTLRSISGLLRPRKGKVLLEGKDDRPPARAHRAPGRPGPGARRPGHLPRPHGHREPGDGRLHRRRQGRRSSRASRTPSACSPG